MSFRRPLGRPRETVFPSGLLVTFAFCTGATGATGAMGRRAAPVLDPHRPGRRDIAGILPGRTGARAPGGRICRAKYCFLPCTRAGRNRDFPLVGTQRGAFEGAAPQWHSTCP